MIARGQKHNAGKRLGNNENQSIRQTNLTRAKMRKSTKIHNQSKGHTQWSKEKSNSRMWVSLNRKWLEFCRGFSDVCWLVCWVLVTEPTLCTPPVLGWPWGLGAGWLGWDQDVMSIDPRLYLRPVSLPVY